MLTCIYCLCMYVLGLGLGYVCTYVCSRVTRITRMPPPLVSCNKGIVQQRAKVSIFHFQAPLLQLKSNMKTLQLTAS